MVRKFCSRSHGQPEPGVRSAAMISISRAISREGFTGWGLIAAGNGDRSKGYLRSRLWIADSHKTYYGIYTGDVSLGIPKGKIAYIRTYVNQTSERFEENRLN